MSWLQKRPQVSDSIQFYNTSLSKTKLIVGLGNPGKEYDGTRHNIGFGCLDYFVNHTDEFEPWMIKKDLKCHFSSARLGDSRVIAIKPTTFMNLSGEAVQAVASFYKISPEDITIIHDELDVEFGQIRLRTGGGSAGHNGLKSIIQHAGENNGRIRIGIGPKPHPEMDSADFVLQKFSASEMEHITNLRKEVSAILSEHLYSGPLTAETRSFLI